jgi:dTDP-D-glucose 4,6-dehydratase
MFFKNFIPYYALFTNLLVSILFITKLLNNEKCPVQGNGLTRRNFIFTDDVSRAVETILVKGEINKTYNIGCNDEYSVLDILEILVR